MLTDLEILMLESVTTLTIVSNNIALWTISGIQCIVCERLGFSKPLILLLWSFVM